MTKAEYKKLHHDIRLSCRNQARTKSETTGREHTTRTEMHNLFLWADDLRKDKFGTWYFKYCCIGDYDTGLIFKKGI